MLKFVRFPRRPKVSVCVPLYNTRPDLLRKMIESVLGQTFTDFEFLILNDSPDNKELGAIVAEYKDKRIIYKRNRRNLGISGARNRLMDMARGEYIAVHDHDDWSLPERFEKQVAFLDSHPHYGAVSCDYYINENIAENLMINVCRDNIDIKINFLYGCFFLHPGCMLRKSVLNKHGLRYEEEYSPSEDYRLFARLAEFTLFKTLPEPLLVYNMYGLNTSKVQQDRAMAMEEEIKFFVKNKFPFSAIAQDIAILRQELGKISQNLDNIAGIVNKRLDF
ncbi:MAG: glycosyltransferase [Rickettsiales bacterium]|jgi:glycosyltransferase involved in cell wall biosynthesis|nr:glycosyltransferase [Rickettsiales bacterium]